jgi:hypothetical protein
MDAGFAHLHALGATRFRRFDCSGGFCLMRLGASIAIGESRCAV